jgi:hypothetical protein
LGDRGGYFKGGRRADIEKIGGFKDHVQDLVIDPNAEIIAICQYERFGRCARGIRMARVRAIKRIDNLKKNMTYLLKRHPH